MNGLRNFAELLPEILAEIRRKPCVVRVPGGFNVHDSESGNVYEIDNSPTSSAADFAFWVRQLGEKEWVTKQHLIDFAQAVIDARDP
jgi:hypothetical protein